MADRLERCLREMERTHVDVLLLGRESNARFVSGAERLWLAGTRAFAPTCVVVRSTGAVHLLSITDECFPPPRADASRRIYPMSWNPVTTVGAVADIEGVGLARRVGVDGLTPMFEQLLRSALPGAEFVDGESIIRTARRLKDEDDVDGVRAAIRVAEESLQAVVDALRPGITERELVGVFEAHMAARGTSTPAYEGTFCVVDGHGPLRRISTDRVIADCELVAMSAGALVDGWEGSLARTVPCGAPSLEQRGQLARWHRRWSDLFGRVEPGVRAGELRSVTERVKVFGIGLGYEGIGDDETLDPGMVIGVELEVAGVLGQDVVLITAGGANLLTTAAYPAFDA